MRDRSSPDGLLPGLVRVSDELLPGDCCCCSDGDAHVCSFARSALPAPSLHRKYEVPPPPPASEVPASNATQWSPLSVSSRSLVLLIAAPLKLLPTAEPLLMQQLQRASPRAPRKAPAQTLLQEARRSQGRR